MILSAKDIYKTVDKSWGYEVWIENNDEYCGKELHFLSKGGHTSLHFHVKKRETMFCVSGTFEILYSDTDTGDKRSVVLSPRDSVEIPRNTPHSIVCLEPGVLMEFSTHHEDSDSYRVSR